MSAAGRILVGWGAILALGLLTGCGEGDSGNQKQLSENYVNVMNPVVSEGNAITTAYVKSCAADPSGNVDPDRCGKDLARAVDYATSALKKMPTAPDCLKSADAVFRQGLKDLVDGGTAGETAAKATDVNQLNVSVGTMNSGNRLLSEATDSMQKASCPS